jgi:hypothetical protein
MNRGLDQRNFGGMYLTMVHNDDAWHSGERGGPVRFLCNLMKGYLLVLLVCHLQSSTVRPDVAFHEITLDLYTI